MATALPLIPYLAMVVGLYLLAPLAGVDKAMLAPGLTGLGLHGGGWLLFVCYHALVNPWFEEVLWRGMGVLWGWFI